MIGRKLAEARLRKRYHEQVLIYPTMRNDIPLAVYITANVRRVMENDFLASYDRLPNVPADKA